MKSKKWILKTDIFKEGLSHQAPNGERTQETVGQHLLPGNVNWPTASVLAFLNLFPFFFFFLTLLNVCYADSFKTASQKMNVSKIQCNLALMNRNLSLNHKMSFNLFWPPWWLWLWLWENSINGEVLEQNISEFQTHLGSIRQSTKQCHIRER